MKVAVRINREKLYSERYTSIFYEGINMVDFSRLIIQHVIIHEVLRQKISQTRIPPTFSDIECELTDEIKLFLKDKIIETVGSSKAYNIEFDPSSASPIPSIITSIIENTYSEENFLNYSKEITTHLNSIQTGRNPGGFFTLILGINNGRKLIGILKIEKEDGALLEQSERNGKRTFEIKKLKDLILTPNTKLLKISVFSTTNSITGRIRDNQLTKKGEVATFFLKDFLGCKFIQEPAKDTQEFFEKSYDYIRDEVVDPRLQNIYRIHLISYLSSESNTVNPNVFATNYLKEEHRGHYRSYLRDREIIIGDTIKDTSYIESKIREMMLEFENGIKIIGRNENFEQEVVIENLPDGRTKATVESRLKLI